MAFLLKCRTVKVEPGTFAHMDRSNVNRFRFRPIGSISPTEIFVPGMFPLVDNIPAPALAPLPSLRTHFDYHPSVADDADPSSAAFNAPELYQTPPDLNRDYWITECRRFKTHFIRIHHLSSVLLDYFVSLALYIRKISGRGSRAFPTADKHIRTTHWDETHMAHALSCITSSVRRIHLYARNSPSSTYSRTVCIYPTTDKGGWANQKAWFDGSRQGPSEHLHQLARECLPSARLLVEVIGELLAYFNADAPGKRLTSDVLVDQSYVPGALPIPGFHLGSRRRLIRDWWKELRNRHADTDGLWLKHVTLGRIYAIAKQKAEEKRRRQLNQKALKEIIPYYKPADPTSE